jgi:hypothetical protein
MSETVADASLHDRLGIVHLMMWAAATALYMGVQRLLIPPQFVTNLQGVQLASMVAEGIGGGAAIAGVLLALGRWFKHMAFPIHPGEWLWLVVGLKIIVSLAISASLLVLNYLAFPIVFGLSAILFLFGAVGSRRFALWRVFFLVACSVSAVQCGLVLVKPGLFFSSAGNPTSDLMRFTALFFAEPMLPLAILIVPLWHDLKRRESLPWTHWAGMGAYVLHGCAITASFIAFA